MANTFSDWRTKALIDACPECGCAHTLSRDAPDGIEFRCAACSWRTTVPALTPEMQARLVASSAGPLGGDRLDS